jgi:multimeric flavodoxin WrbA
MQTLLISGSRNVSGQTARALEAVRAGIENAGGGTETVFLPPLDIARCRQCEDDGWGLCLKDGRCVMDDDFAGLLERLRSADAVVFATPVYYSDLSESLRAFLDRLRRICTRPTHRAGINGKPALAVCVAGGGGGGAPACCRSIEWVLGNCGFSVCDTVAVRRQNLDAKQTALAAAGAALITSCAGLPTTNG